MGKKKPKPRRAPLEKKLRKLPRTRKAELVGDEGEHIEVAEAASAVVPAEVQLGGGDVLGSLAQVPPGPPSRPSDSTPTMPSGTETDAAGGSVDGRRFYDLFDAIQNRRSHKRFQAAPVSRRALEVMFEAAVLAPNHKLTEPWGFVVLGERAKRAYADVRARTKAPDEADAERRARIFDEVMDIPTIIAVTMNLDEDPLRREEDYAATFMAVQNLLLAGTALGLATKINTGRVMDHPELREIVGVRADQRIVALINVGLVAESRGAGKRTPAAEKTTWLS